MQAYTQLGSWVVIYPIVYTVDWLYLNTIIADRTQIRHRALPASRTRSIEVRRCLRVG